MKVTKGQTEAGKRAIRPRDFLPLLGVLVILVLVAAMVVLPGRDEPVSHEVVEAGSVDLATVFTGSTGPRLCDCLPLGNDRLLLFSDMDFPPAVCDLDGNLIWRFQPEKGERMYSIARSPDRIYIATNLGRVSAHDLGGVEQWVFKAKDHGSIACELCSIATGPNGQVYLTIMNTGVFAIKPDGELDWKHDLKATQGVRPVVSPDGRIHVHSLPGKLHALSPEGRELWFASSAPLCNQLLINPATGNPVGANVNSGTIKSYGPDGKVAWQQHATLSDVSRPAVMADGTFVILTGTEFAPGILAISATGEVLWERSLEPAGYLRFGLDAKDNIWLVYNESAITKPGFDGLIQKLDKEFHHAGLLVMDKTGTTLARTELPVYSLTVYPPCRFGENQMMISAEDTILFYELREVSGD